MNDGSSWFAEVDASTTTAEVAAALGLTVKRRRFAPCPSCGADDRHRGVVTAYAKTWACRCGGGNMVQLVGAVLATEDWGVIRAWFADRGWCSSDGRERATWSPPPPRPVEPEPDYPDVGEVAALRGQMRAVGDDPDVAAVAPGTTIGPAAVSVDTSGGRGAPGAKGGL